MGGILLIMLDKYPAIEFMNSLFANLEWDNHTSSLPSTTRDGWNLAG